MGFTDLFREARKRDEYWIEDAIISFTSQLYSIMRKKGLSVTAVAEQAGVAQPYVTRVLKGRDNLTIATMVKLSRAAGVRLHISLREDTVAASDEKLVRVPLEVSQREAEGPVPKSGPKPHRSRKAPLPGSERRTAR